mgnify:CR=1 FL=1
MHDHAVLFQLRDELGQVLIEVLDHIGTQRVILQYDIPLGEIIYDYYDMLKSASHGYATLDAARLWAELPAGIDAFEAFARAISAWIGGAG